MTPGRFALLSAVMSTTEDVPVRDLLAARPAWQRNAACRGYPTSWWFPPRGETPSVAANTAAALALCDACPVQADCHAWALEHDERGTWGGMRQSQRKPRGQRAA